VLEGVLEFVFQFKYEMLSEISRTVIVVTASVKEDEKVAKATFSQAYCISMPRDTML
jgi:hypothetical protein